MTKKNTVPVVTYPRGDFDLICTNGVMFAGFKDLAGIDRRPVDEFAGKIIKIGNAEKFTSAAFDCLECLPGAWFEYVGHVLDPILKEFLTAPARDNKILLFQSFSGDGPGPKPTRGYKSMFVAFYDTGDFLIRLTTAQSTRAYAREFQTL